MSPIDRGHVAEASPTVTIIWKPGFTYQIHVFFGKKLKSWAITESFLKLSDFEYSEFLTSFLKVP